MARKFLVALKKNPSMIPFSMLIISFLVFSLNLTPISNTTPTIGGDWTGICEFVSMLFSILSMICMLNAYPKRQKPNYLMVGLLLVMFVVIIVCDIAYGMQILSIIAKHGASIKPTQYAEYTLSYGVVIAHAILVAITGVTAVLEPWFAKLLKKINTSVEIETTNVANIELSEEE